MNPIVKLKQLIRKQPDVRSFDRENLHPVIRASICTGEQTAGFQNIHTGKFTEVMLIRTEADLAQFRKDYDISPEEITTEY